uniref:uncharacterized protein LOC120326488 n=1 Tax=Styela clava TaxID=7725 RepID=UPI00193AAB78|nr:uncharacterized protein LOC120326488 [Styela clava]
MNNLIVISAIFLLFAVAEISGICCGRGKNGFCKDCAKVSIWGHRKCCGSGSGHGKGCNILCCNCGLCRNGRASITFLSGWFLSKKYSCKLKLGDEEVQQKNQEDLKNTWDVFNELDKDEDGAISQSEFREAMVARLLDNESGQLVASHVLDSNNEEDVLALLDVVTEQDGQDLEQSKDLYDLIKQEFQKLDADNDGMIQAAEFDKDLK